MREDVVTMVRARNESRWIVKLLERVFEVCQTIVILDDGSTDNQEHLVLEYMGSNVASSTRVYHHSASISKTYKFGDRYDVMHYIQSPFRHADENPDSSPNEIRDRQFLWDYVQAMVPAKFVLCLDGDETLSNELVRKFESILDPLYQDICSVMTFPFIYLWDSENKRRIDGWYGDLKDGAPIARFPRLFSLRGLTINQKKIMRIPATPNLLHCGSIPIEAFKPFDADPKLGLAFPPILHYGYIDNELRQAKFQYYNTIDPDNEKEGHYLHIIGKPNRFCEKVATVDFPDE